MMDKAVIKNASGQYGITLQTLGDYYSSMKWDVPERRKGMEQELGVRAELAGSTPQWMTMAQAQGAGLIVPEGSPNE